MPNAILTPSVEHVDPEDALFRVLLDGIERAAWEQRLPTMVLGSSLADRLVQYFDTAIAEKAMAAMSRESQV